MSLIGIIEMKATLEFNLPEDEERFNVASKAVDLYLALLDIHNEIRSHWKYEEHSEEVYNIVEKIHDEFFEILTDHGLSLEMMS
jgi:hypothetical protein